MYAIRLLETLTEVIGDYNICWLLIAVLISANLQR